MRSISWLIASLRTSSAFPNHREALRFRDGPIDLLDARRRFAVIHFQIVAIWWHSMLITFQAGSGI
jgi:hypothetical protein